jgi:predicted nuclease of predicted toxin-antitoxin system
VARLYVDEYVPLEVADELQRLGHDVGASREAGHANAGVADRSVLRLAAALRRVVVTLDRDYLRLHRQCPWHAGIVWCSADLDPIALAGRLDAALRGRLEPWPGCLVGVYRPNPPPD